MVKLGTHNSLSYLPCQWWLRLFSWIGRCQSIDLEEQYYLGVRLFDIRIKYVNDQLLSGHGLLTYKADIEHILSWFNNKGDCIIRLFLENSRYNPTKYFDRFNRDISNWQCKYNNIKFIEGGCRYNYRKFINNEPILIYHNYWTKKYIIPYLYPKLFAKKLNQQLHLKDSENYFSMYDFIQYGNPYKSPNSRNKI